MECELQEAQPYILYGLTALSAVLSLVVIVLGALMSRIGRENLRLRTRVVQLLLKESTMTDCTIASKVYTDSDDDVTDHRRNSISNRAPLKPPSDAAEASEGPGKTGSRTPGTEEHVVQGDYSYIVTCSNRSGSAPMAHVRHTVQPLAERATTKRYAAARKLLNWTNPLGKRCNVTSNPEVKARDAAVTKQQKKCATFMNGSLFSRHAAKNSKAGGNKFSVVVERKCVLYPHTDLPTAGLSSTATSCPPSEYLTPPIPHSTSGAVQGSAYFPISLPRQGNASASAASKPSASSSPYEVEDEEMLSLRGTMQESLKSLQHVPIVWRECKAPTTTAQSQTQPPVPLKQQQEEVERTLITAKTCSTESQSIQPSSQVPTGVVENSESKDNSAPAWTGSKPMLVHLPEVQSVPEPVPRSAATLASLPRWPNTRPSIIRTTAVRGSAKSLHYTPNSAGIGDSGKEGPDACRAITPYGVTAAAMFAMPAEDDEEPPPLPERGYMDMSDSSSSDYAEAYQVMAPGVAPRHPPLGTSVISDSAGVYDDCPVGLGSKWPLAT